MESSDAHELILGQVHELHPHATLVQVVHVFREANRVADMFATCV
ncbi:uncharacterized protein G2W53_020971 [Senna tora]|uniref:RNase H type-1 domain-containing protein n=1 Tax=Senna tora TaxID=362788 RepID=A0A834TK86_9FABA|nr:uncharacterized protein G2W53_020971 [Senna tora]